MKRVYILATFSIIIFTALNAKAQVKSYISLYGGISDPLSNYASTDYNNNQAAYAKRGVTFSLDGAYYIYKHLAIGATISFQDQGKLLFNDVDNLAQGYTASYGADQSTVNAYDRFHNWNILIGPQYSFEFSKFIVDVRVSAGAVKVSSTPETSIVLVGVPDQTATFYQRSASAFVFGYGGNVGLRYKLGESWTVGLKAAYVYSDGPSIRNDGLTTTAEGRYVTKLPITELQVTAGLSVNF